MKYLIKLRMLKGLLVTQTVLNHQDYQYYLEHSSLWDLQESEKIKRRGNNHKL